MTTNLTYKQNYSLEDLPGEQWKDIPALDGAYLLSNHGRVKALSRWVERPGSRGGFWKKERILKNRVRVWVQESSKDKRKKYRLAILISFEGKDYHFQIGRMVYYFFVNSFNLEDRHYMTAFKDGDPFNVHYSNLLMVPASEVSLLSYKNNHRPRECFGNKALAVVQYNTKGEKLAEYPSMYFAANATGLNIGAIFGQLNEGIGYTGGFIWRFKKNDNRRNVVSKAIIKRMASKDFHNKIISQYDLSGKKLKEYINLKAAAKDVVIQPNQLRMVLLGKHSTAAGYYWKLGKGEEQVSVEHLWQRRKKWSEKIARPVTQYNMEGNFVAYYNSILEAARQTGFSPETIFSALKGGASRTSNGFIWHYGKGIKKIAVPNRIKRKMYLANLFAQPVIQYSLDGKKIGVHAHLKDAAKKVKGQVYSLVAAIKGKKISFKGYYWKLENSVKLSKTTKASNGVKKISL